MTTALPIEAVLPNLLEGLKTHNQAVLQAPPGAGKTTRVPLFLHTTGIFQNKIIMLEPRRLAARGAAERMAQTLSEQVGQTVGYRMRGDSKISKATRIEIVTEGVLTRMIQSDPELSGVSCIIFDEFHERSLQADLGLALCLEIRAALRPDLCIIPMSATLDAAPVAKLMGNAPIITAEGKSYPVEQFFLSAPWKRPNHKAFHFVQAAANLISQAIQDTDEIGGDILTFLPGAGEIHRTAQLLNGKLGADVSIHPLYGAMPFKDQRAAISPTTTGRKLVLATSIAETSLTIPNVRVVVDTGLSRHACFDTASGMSRLVTTRATKAEATQRQGRAGRVAAGVCYKMWTQGENGGLAPYPEPEIRSADLTGLVLELALWGADTPASMPFLTQPRDNDFAQAQSLLRLLGALDHNNHITPYGHAIATIPTHPRLAHMLKQGGTDATLMAALIDNRDPLRKSGAQPPVDIHLRWQALKYSQKSAYPTDVNLISQIKQDANRLPKFGGKPKSIGAMAALAYPDRIAMRRKGGPARFLLSGGKGAYMDDADPLANERLIVATELDGNTKEARIRLAATITETELRSLYPHLIKNRNTCLWNKRNRQVDAISETCFMALSLESSIWKNCPNDELAMGMVEGVRDLGLSVLPFTKAATLFLGRVQWLHQNGSPIPDLSDHALTDTLETWLQPHLSGMKRLDDLKRLDMLAIMRNLLDWNELQLVDKLAPASISAPTGTVLPIDYTGDHPSISVRLQELFGLTKHPTIGPNRVPLQIELLSPARRPVQITNDLPGFWKSSYIDVRKDMRGRYPKHPWPEDPTSATATRRVKSKP